MFLLISIERVLIYGNTNYPNTPFKINNWRENGKRESRVDVLTGECLRKEESGKETKISKGLLSQTEEFGFGSETLDSI